MLQRSWLSTALSAMLSVAMLPALPAVWAVRAQSPQPAQSPQNPNVKLTTIADTVLKADGTPASGTLLVSWPAFVTAGGTGVPAGASSFTLGANGALSVKLVPNAGATPIGSYYTVVYHLGGSAVTREYWVVPASGSPVTLSAIRSTVLPASVAAQFVTKGYVDQAVAQAVTGTPEDASPYVLKAGDTMTGPLVLPGDPTAPLQAADMAYVDAQSAALSAGLGQKVSTQPQATQTVVQPAGTQLHVNNLNGALYASQYASASGAGAGNNGLANALASPDCTGGCQVVAEQTYASGESVPAAQLPDKTHVEDRRGGTLNESFRNTLNPNAGGQNGGETIDLVSTQSAQSVFAAVGTEGITAQTVNISNQALAGGANTYPKSIQSSVPYFKTTFSALALTGNNYTVGQHVLTGMTQNCFGVGDCLMGGNFMVSSGGFRDDADEGAHPFDQQYAEDARVFDGACGTGCTAGATVLQIVPTQNAGTQGEGRYLLNTNPAKTITAGQLIGGSFTARLPMALFQGTNFALSVFVETAQTIPTQSNNLEPGTVTVPIMTSGVPAGFATNTAALPAAAGVACVSDNVIADQRPLNFETAAYTVIDGSHLQLTLTRPHAGGATVAVGGLCGYGLEQVVDTVQGIRQVYPIVGSNSATSAFYAGGETTALVGSQGLASAFANLNLVVASLARTGNVVTVTLAGNLAQDVNGLPLTVQGATDASYNGTYTVTTTGVNTLTYADNGPDSSSAGGTLTYLTGSYVLYPMAEVESVYNPASKAVDGYMRLAANTVAWAANDPVEQPHYFQEQVLPDTEFITQYEPRPASISDSGIVYQGNNGPGLIGFTIANGSDPGQYFGQGGTHSIPTSGIDILGPWRFAMQMQAGDEAALQLRCNSHGCDKWNSGYAITEMQTSVGVDNIFYQPQTSGLSFNLRGTNYSFGTTGFTAGTINVGTLNAGTVKGQFVGSVSANSVPVFGASGAGHAQGAVPDPGTAGGATRFLREDGTWAAVPAAVAAAAPAPGAGTSTTALTTSGPINLPGRADLLGEYLMTEGTGTTVHDSGGRGNDAVLGGVNGGPAWEGSGSAGAADLNFTQVGEYVQLPVPLNYTRTWQFVFYNPPFGNPANVLQAPGEYRPDFYGGNPSILCGTDGGHLCLTANSLVSNSQTPKSWRFYASNSDHTESAEVLTAGWHAVTLVCGSEGATPHFPSRLLFDGREVGGYLAQDEYTCQNGFASGNYQLGGSSLLGNSWFVGKMAAVWAWNRALTMNEASAAARSGLDYLHAKGVAGTFGKTVRAVPVVLAGLDSRTAGVNVSAPWPVLMHLADPTYAVSDVGVSGATVFDVCAQFELSYGAQLAPGNGPAVLVLWGGVNDFQASGARDVANSLKCVVQKAKAAGARVVLATEISSSSLAAGDADKDALDTILRTEAWGWGIDNLADLATDPLLGADGASANTNCFSDHLHPSDACEPHITSIMQNAVNELLGSSENNRTQVSGATYAETATDRYLDLTGANGGAQSLTLPDCTGYALKREVLNLGTSAATVSAVSGQTLTGAGAAGAQTLNPGARAIFVPVPGAPAAAGCRWERTE